MSMPHGQGRGGGLAPPPVDALSLPVFGWHPDQFGGAAAFSRPPRIQGGIVSRHSKLRWFRAAATIVLLAPALAVAAGSGTPANATGATTAWQQGTFSRNV